MKDFGLSSSLNAKQVQDMFTRIADVKRDITTDKTSIGDSDVSKSSDKKSFFDHLKSGIADIDSTQKNADKMSTEVATGKSGNLHETMLAMTQAELSFDLLVQMRNRALEAYQEIMRMQV